MCEHHFCTTCLKMSDEVYDYMVAKCDDNMWCCEKCFPRVRSLIQDSKKKTTPKETEKARDKGNTGAEGEDLKELVKEMMTEFKGMMGLADANNGSKKAKERKNVARNAEGEETDEGDESQETGAWQTASRRKKPSTLVEAFIECNREAEVVSRRKRNIVIHKFEESKDESHDARIAHDMNFATTLVREVLLVQSEVMEVRRLGKKMDTENPRRPLLVTFANEWEKRKVVDSLYKLKNAAAAFKAIRITEDLPKEERDEIKKLIEEAKNLTAKDSGNFFYIVRNKKILKVQRRTKSGEIQHQVPQPAGPSE